jgi:excisionase family DNA binding protein
MRSNRRENDGGGKSPLTASAETVEPKSVPFAQRLTCTIGEACEATGLGRTKLYELIGTGHLVTTTVGRRRLVIVYSLLSLLETNKST